MNKNQSIGMYVILGIMVLAFVSMLFSGPTSSTQELSYTTFIQKVEQKEIKSVDMGRDMLIAVPFKQPEAKKTEVNPLYGEIKAPKLQYKVAFPENSDVLAKLEENNVEINVKKSNESGSMFGLGSSFITILLVLGFIMLIIKSIQAGGAQAMSFGKSRAKMLMDNKVKTRFSDVAGIDEEKKELEEIIKTKTQAYVLDKADSLGLDLEVEITVDNSELPVPVSVVLTGAAAPYAKARLSNIIANDLAVPKEAQIWN
jgi:cell division protease FtsH